MNPPLRKIIVFVVGCAAVATLAVGVLLGIIASPPSLHVEPTARALVVAPAPSSTATAQPAPTTTPGPPISVNLTSFDRQPTQGGITATITIENHRSEPLSFSFDPTFDLRAVDAHGHTWPLRWAEYDGAPKIAANSSARLVRGFFAGPVTSAASWPLTITVERAPGLGNVEWHVTEHGTPTPAVESSVVRIPTIVPSGSISLQVANPQPSSGLGGTQVDLMIRNDRATELAFNFDPNQQITAEDNLHRPYQVRWAQYGGVVKVAPHSTARLARVFLAGPIADAQASWLTVSLHQVPGAQPLKTVVALY